MAAHSSPSGKQFHASWNDHHLVAVEVGGGIRSYRCGDFEVLDGYAQTEMCTAGRGQLLLPWPNRLAGGSYEWQGRRLQLALSEPEHLNAIHGLVRWLPFVCEESTGSRLRLRCRLHPQPGWPWPLDAVVTYDLTGGLTVGASITNPGGAGPCPVGLGWHPYLSAFGAEVDDLQLSVPAASFYRSDDRGLPIAKESVERTDWDFRVPRPVGPAHLDVAYTDLERDHAGRAVIEVRAADNGSWPTAVRLWMDSRYTHVMLYTGDTIAEESRRRRAIAVEPMTAAPDMLNNHDGIVVLQEGETLEAQWGVELVGGYRSS